MEYELEDVRPRGRAARAITLHLNDEDKEFLEPVDAVSKRAGEVLRTSCPCRSIVSEVKALRTRTKARGRRGREAEGRARRARADQRHPSALAQAPRGRAPTRSTTTFYHKVFHDYDEPLFWIHLNAEYPFNLKGILYFPKLKNEFTASEGVRSSCTTIRCSWRTTSRRSSRNSCMLLKGVIDCPDLPLNVSPLASCRTTAM